LSNFNILGVLQIFDSAESISTAKNIIQTPLLQDFFKFEFFTQIPTTFDHPQ